MLDGYEEAAVGGYDLHDARYGTDTPIRIEGGSGKLSVFVRAKPGDTKAPVAIHLVEKEKGAASTLRLPTARFFGQHKFKVTLREPLAYDASLHAQAEKDKNYRSLIRQTILPTTTEGSSTLVSLPPLKPWGILVVEMNP